VAVGEGDALGDAQLDMVRHGRNLAHRAGEGNRLASAARSAGYSLPTERGATVASQRKDVLMIAPMMPMIIEQLDAAFTLHKLWLAPDKDKAMKELEPKLQALAGSHARIDGAFMSRFPKLEFISNFGVGYDDIDATWAGQHGIMVTNTPDVLNEEVADTAIALLLMTVRRLSQAEKYLRAGKWREKMFPLSESLRDRTVGMVGMGRIGRAIARRLDAMRVPVVYHTRTKRDVQHRHYPDLVAMARDVDALMVIVPGGAETKNMINAKVLEALGPKGVLVNVSRGSVVDEPALIDALKSKKILSAGLDVFPNEPEVNPELIAMEDIVLLPHVGSGSVETRRAMGQLVVDNLLAWRDGKPPLTPVPETPYPPKKRNA
jgi:lactate dehydrogenase-like 2-hydroxyacid dehydrogenase